MFVAITGFQPADTSESTYLGTGFLVDLAGLELAPGCPGPAEGSDDDDFVAGSCFWGMFNIFGQFALSNIC